MTTRLETWAVYDDGKYLGDVRAGDATAALQAARERWPERASRDLAVLRV